MALRAGRVGVSPDIVDNNGFIKNMGGGGEPVDAYTKAETNALLAEKADTSTVTAALALKADQSNLTANSKDFIFAYSNGQYGYKAGATGAFTPFSRPGWNKPGLLSELFNFSNENLVRVSGGWYVENEMIYIDIIYQRVATGSSQITSLPRAAHNHSAIVFRLDTLPENIDDFFTESTADFTMSAVNDGTKYTKYTDNNGNLGYRRMIAWYPYESVDINTKCGSDEEEPIKEPPEEEPSEEIKSTTKKSTRRK